nr:ion transporter [Moraxella macacae]
MPVTTHLRKKLYNILQNYAYDSPVSRYTEYFLIFLILLNVLAVILSSVNEWYMTYRGYFDFFERFSLAIFSLEYFVRLWVIAEIDETKSAWQNRKEWLFSTGSVIDFIAIFPAYLNFFVPINLRLLIVLRLLRLFKLTRYFLALRILLNVIKREKESFKAVIFILLILIILSASGIYAVENKAQPHEFESIPKAMWWAVVTLTTVGYGDVTPVTMMGKFLGAMITILGVGLAALPAGILASGLATELEHRRKSTENLLRQSIMDKNLDVHEESEAIERLRRELNLSQEQAVRVVEELKQDLELNQKITNSLNFCPNCGCQLAHLHDNGSPNHPPINPKIDPKPNTIDHSTTDHKFHNLGDIDDANPLN